MRTYNPWHANHDKFIKDNYGKMTATKMVEGLSNIEPKAIRTVAAIHMRCNTLKLSKTIDKKAIIHSRKSYSKVPDSFIKESENKVFGGNLVKQITTGSVYKTATGVIHKSK